MWVYDSLTKIGFKSRFWHKILIISLIGTNLPLIGLLLIKGGNLLTSTEWMFISAMTISAGFATFLVLNNLLAPFKKTKSAVTNYLNHSVLPDLSTNYNDEAGDFMRKMQSTLRHLDTLKKSKKELLSILNHEGKDHITKMVNLTELIIKESKDKETLLSAEWIKNYGYRQLSLINDVIRLLSQTDFEIKEYEKQSIWCSELVENSILSNKDQLDNRNISVTYDQPNDHLIFVNQDSFGSVIKTLLRELGQISIDNSCIAMSSMKHKNNVELQIKCPVSMSNIVIDTEAHIQSISESLSSGLPMQVVKRIIEQHNGHMVLKQDTLPPGLTIKIKIPHPLSVEMAA
ncbi:MAG: HAMP domain-containing histidine kinase [Cyclobacteriaceae bacterium]